MLFIGLLCWDKLGCGSLWVWCLADDAWCLLIVFVVLLLGNGCVRLFVVLLLLTCWFGWV